MESKEFFQNDDQDYNLISEENERLILSTEQSAILLTQTRENIIKVNAVGFESVELLRQELKDITKVED